MLKLPNEKAASFNTYEELKKRYPKISSIGLGIFVGLALLLSTISVKLGESTYWAASRGRLAEKLLNDIKNLYPTLPPESAVYLKNDPEYPFVAEQWGDTSKQASFVLNGSDAVQLFYKEPTVKVFYKDLGGVPTDFPVDKLHPLVARMQ